MTERQESDQLPEEGPSQQVHDDDKDAGARSDAERSAGARSEQDETATGNPAAAGAEDPDE